MACTCGVYEFVGTGETHRTDEANLGLLPTAYLRDIPTRGRAPAGSIMDQGTFEVLRTKSPLWRQEYMSTTGYTMEEWANEIRLRMIQNGEAIPCEDHPQPFGIKTESAPIAVAVADFNKEVEEDANSEKKDGIQAINQRIEKNDEIVIDFNTNAQSDVNVAKDGLVFSAAAADLLTSISDVNVMTESNFDILMDADTFLRNCEGSSNLAIDVIEGSNKEQLDCLDSLVAVREQTNGSFEVDSQINQLVQMIAGFNVSNAVDSQWQGEENDESKLVAASFVRSSY